LVDYKTFQSQNTFLGGPANGPAGHKIRGNMLNNISKRVNRYFLVSFHSQYSALQNSNNDGMASLVRGLHVPALKGVPQPGLVAMLSSSG
jgi:hypothetical protein